MTDIDPRFVTPANHVSKPTFGKEDGEKQLRYGYEYLDFISVLDEFNRRRIAERTAPQGTVPFQAIPTPVVELFYDICRAFEMPPDVKYMALEIFDWFIVNHYIDLREYTITSSGDKGAQKDYWHRISNRVQKQSLLRIVSCIQIASKFVLQSASLTLQHVKKFLNDCNHNFNLHSICLSEIRVFSTIGCKVPLYSIFDFTRTLLEGLQFWINIDPLYRTCEKVLQFTYLQRDEIYRRYFWAATGRWEGNRQERLQFSKIELDNFLLAASVIVSSLYIHHFEELGPNKTSEIFSELGSMSGNDIRRLAVIISQMVLGTRSVTLRSCN